MTTENQTKTTKYDQKFDLWEKKLFDLSLRNALLNVRLTGAALPFVPARPGSVLEALRTGTSFAVYPNPASESPAEGRQRAEEGLQSGRLYADCTAYEIGQRLRRMARLSKSSLEETGSSNLYWGIGLLRWFDKKSKEQERYAPLLLLPAEIRRKQGPVPFIISAQDEEPLLNQTLLEKLKLDYGLEAGDGKHLLTDRQEDGIDLEAVFAWFRELVAPMGDWEILDTVCIGIFSYAKYMMWEDLHYHREKIGQNPIVRSLAGGSIEWKEDMSAWHEECAQQEVLSPVSLDTSQLMAVRASAAGKSFVLHGPPGTGKSQTITAIIATALASGRTVLFVAEKMAALSVVHNRLAELGLGDYCLELYSRKTRKKEFIEKLTRAAQGGRKEEKTSYAETSALYEKRREALEAYRESLHAEGNAGLSVWQLMDLYESFEAEIPLQEMDGETAVSLTAQELAERCEMLERLVAAGRSVGHPHAHPLEAVGESEYTQEYRVQMEEKIASYLQAVDTLEKAVDAYTEKTGEPRPSGQAALKKTQAVTEELDRWKELPEHWAASENPNIYLEKAAAVAQHYQNMIQCRDRLLKVFSPDVLELAEEEADRMRGDYQSARRSWALPRYFGKRRLEAELNEYAADGQKILRRKLGQYTQDIQYYQREYRLYREALEACGNEVEPFRNEKGEISIAKLLKAAAAAAQSAQRLRLLTGNDKVRRERAGKPGFKKEIAALNLAFSCAGDEEKALKSFLQYRESEETRKKAQKDWFEAQRQFCTLLREHGQLLREWMVWNQICGEAEAMGLGPQTEAYRGGMAHEDVVPSYRKSWTRAALREQIEKDPLLNTFSGTLFEEQIAVFRKMDAEMTSLTREEIRARLAGRVPDFVQEASENPALSVFRKILMSGGKGMTIREMMSVMAPVLPRICPCMLMSPVSAAQYLDPDREPFDLVVFDEASQITTSNAVGAIARGRNAIIVGDPNQMPPTNFFTQEIELTEDPLADDLGSILEDCIAINLPQLYLAWHYRSRHESLIAFSNTHFYESRLFTFPSADDGVRKVSLYYADGQFESGGRRTNLAEAEAIISELRRRSRDEELRGQSVGIVTFNIQQQTLIEDLYEEALQESAALRQWDEKAAEPLFIKNLENVQGDERDVILFSTTYGPAPDGRMSLNFGPLNREGGWRRLNVAVTRARAEMIVFTSIHPERAGLDRSLSQGVRMLDAFLRYAAGAESTGAAGGAEQKSNTAEGQSGHGIALELCRRLEQAGHSAVCGVGRSSFRVDVGIPDPEDPQRYILGILLDGDRLTKDTTVRDLEVGRVQVLRGLGWELMPVRMIDWYDNRDKVTASVLQRLSQIQEKNAG